MLKYIFKLGMLYYVGRFVLTTGQVIVQGTKIYHKFYPSKPDPRLIIAKKSGTIVSNPL